MTPNQAERLAQSLNYRRRLNEKVPILEAKLKESLTDRVGINGKNGQITALLGRFKLKLKGNELKDEEVDPTDPNQLKFRFIKEEKNEDRNC